jgi:tetratricopeptide (TPR) repeat protein
LFNRGNAYYYKKNYDKAIADYYQAIRLNPNIAIFYYNRGAAWQAKGDKTKANADFEKANLLGYKP